MCLYLIAHQIHPDYPLILAGNRDEFYHRPTSLLDFWLDAPGILAGRDLKGQGTWLGISRQGRLAVLTNYREMPLSRGNTPSRGALVSNFLAGRHNPKAYLHAVSARATDYPGFNLIVGDGPDLFYFSNRLPGIRPLTPGIYALSNHLLNTAWPKLFRAVSAFSDLLQAKSRVQAEDLLTILVDQHKPPDDSLPHTGVGLSKERMLSSVFVTSPDYGTRCSSLILVDRRNKVLFREQTWRPAQAKPTPSGNRQFTFTIDTSFQS